MLALAVVLSDRTALLTYDTWHLKPDSWHLTLYMSNIKALNYTWWGRSRLPCLCPFWQLTCDTWHMTSDICHMIPDPWQVTPDTWHMMHNTCHMTPDTKQVSLDTYRETMVDLAVTFFSKHVTDLRHDTGNVTNNTAIWHLTCDTCHLSSDTWQLTRGAGLWLLLLRFLTCDIEVNLV